MKYSRQDPKQISSSLLQRQFPTLSLRLQNLYCIATIKSYYWEDFYIFLRRMRLYNLLLLLIYIFLRSTFSIPLQVFLELNFISDIREDELTQKNLNLRQF